MLRRLFRRVGWVGATAWAWSHRGTVARAVDAGRHAPARIRSGRTADVLTELRAITRLDRRPALARRTDVRIGAVGDGGVVLVAPPECAELEQARLALAGLPGVLDVRTIDPDAAPAAVHGTVRSTFMNTPNEDPTPATGEQPNRAETTSDGEPAFAPLDESPLGHTPMENNKDAKERRASPQR